MPETSRERIRTYMTEYTGEKPKEQALNELAIAMFGEGRYMYLVMTESANTVYVL